MRLADADVLPYQFTGRAETVGRYAKEVAKLLKDTQDTIRERNRELDDGLFAATTDPREPLVPPPRQELPPFLNFAPLDNAVDLLTRASDRYEHPCGRAHANGRAARAPPESQAVDPRLIPRVRAP